MTVADINRIWTLALDVGFTIQGVAQMTSLYTEDHRYYHNMNHIIKLLELAKKDNYDKDQRMIQLILAHDVVWYPQSKFNEELSAAWYKANIREPFYEHDVFEGILASKNHTNPAFNNLPMFVKYFLDYDLAGLADMEEYSRNAIAIYNEFTAIYDSDTYIEGRIKFIEKILASPKIYWNHPEWEEPARNNLQDTLDHLLNI